MDNKIDLEAAEKLANEGLPSVGQYQRERLYCATIRDLVTEVRRVRDEYNREASWLIEQRDSALEERDEARLRLTEARFTISNLESSGVDPHALNETIARAERAERPLTEERCQHDFRPFLHHNKDLKKCTKCLLVRGEP